MINTRKEIEERWFDNPLYSFTKDYLWKILQQ